MTGFDRSDVSRNLPTPGFGRVWPIIRFSSRSYPVGWPSLTDHHFVSSLFIHFSILTWNKTKKTPKIPQKLCEQMTSKTMNDIFREEVSKFFMEHFEKNKPHGSDLWSYHYYSKVTHSTTDPCSWKKLRLILSWVIGSKANHWSRQKLIDHLLLCYKRNFYDNFLILGGLDDEPHRKKKKNTTDK